MSQEQQIRMLAPCRKLNLDIADGLLSITAYMKRPDLSKMNKERAMKIDHTGEKYGIMICVGRGEKRKTKWLWKVKCDCGNEKQMPAGNMIRAKSCGCLTNEIISKARTRHGLTDSPTWRSWKSMHDRIKPSHKSHKSYSDKNISICNEWMVFEKFYADMGNRPLGMTLDRINNELGYFKENCRWATAKEQARNRDCNVKIEINNQTKTVAEHCEENKIPRDVFEGRIKCGWNFYDAINRPIRKMKNNRLIHS